ncbi:MAG: hypothetical protein DLM67_04795 [Candidatus Nephthysia bennettiae]|uniref:MFS transporter n=1 Tax=Candidatus Nephthysia bennettiae TaxID=3127016 RepID=A0A934K8M1_9BACT|nr:hypothetical protein [Candidatus Dormibacteraeota bacterium]PZR98944.1 MAG: hypothetical protein DLM67_04795 [Candidatus Dormibacteraeota bacterium]
MPQAVIQKLLEQGQALTGVGGGLAGLGGALPAQLRPLVPQITAGIKDALAAAVAQLFWITLAAGLLALVCTLVLRDTRLRGGQELRREVLEEGVEAPIPAPVAPSGEAAS